jgi:hypothetical protein
VKVIKCGKVWSLFYILLTLLLSNVIIYRIKKKLCLPIGLGAKSETFAQQPTEFQERFLIILRAAGTTYSLEFKTFFQNFFEQDDTSQS